MTEILQKVWETEFIQRIVIPFVGLFLLLPWFVGSVAATILGARVARRFDRWLTGLVLLVICGITIYFITDLTAQGQTGPINVRVANSLHRAAEWLSGWTP